MAKMPHLTMGVCYHYTPPSPFSKLCFRKSWLCAISYFQMRQHLRAPTPVSQWVSESVSESLIVSDLEIDIASPSFASFLFILNLSLIQNLLHNGKVSGKQRDNANALTKPLRRQFSEASVGQYIPCKGFACKLRISFQISQYHGNAQNIPNMCKKYLYCIVFQCPRSLKSLKCTMKCFKDKVKVFQRAKQHRFPCLQKQKSDQSCQQSLVSVEDRERNLPGSRFALKSFPPIFQALLGKVYTLWGGQSAVSPV